MNSFDELFKSIEKSRTIDAKQWAINGINQAYILLFVLYMYSKYKQINKHLIIVLPSSKDTQKWFNLIQDNLGFLGGIIDVNDLLYLPYYTRWGTERYVTGDYSQSSRLSTLSQLIQGDSGKLVVTNIPALLQNTIEPEELKKHILPLKIGLELDPDELIAKLKELNYHETEFVASHGEFSIRGGVVDIFSPVYSDPVRIEFWGDEIAEMRWFSADSQTSFGKIDGLLVSPVYEAILREKDKSINAQKVYDQLLACSTNKELRDAMVQDMLDHNVCEYMEMFLPLFRNNSVPTYNFFLQEFEYVFPLSLSSSLESAERIIGDLKENCEKDFSDKKPSLNYVRHFSSLSEFKEAALADCHLLDINNPFSGLPKIELRQVIPSDLRDFFVRQQGLKFDQKLKILFEQLVEGRIAVLIFCSDVHEAVRLKSMFLNRNLVVELLDSALAAFEGHSFKTGRIYLHVGNLSESLYFETMHLLVLPEEAFLGKKLRQRRTAKRLKRMIKSFSELEVNDYVVHATYGIAQYQGIKLITVGNEKNELIKLVYRNDDKIYLPVDRLSLLQKFASKDEKVVLDKLGDDAWVRRKAKTKTAVRDIAEKLLKIYASRKLAKGHKFSHPSDEYLRFESEFPFEETPDQINAVQDIENDLLQGVLMDRLICGDVGFGKTEVAMRAAMRTVLEGKQVMILAPTTVLSFQHFNTFVDRFRSHGAEVALINRFVPTKSVKKSIDLFSKGKIDILIGTHRLLSKDVKSLNLGLLVVDEEQRFGVVHKEKIKEIKADANVLTLTATPIPRTLHMSLLGLRDISILASPPKNRIPVKTFVADFDETVVVDAIKKEVSRGGQVFFIHNRVHDIFEIQNLLKKLLPEVTFTIAHGQLPAAALEAAILEFLQGKSQVLVATTIIESGIDMPNVNTLIVNRAENFGLSQLYQLRGRVGRSDKQAYAYFMTGKQKVSPEAKDRLLTLSTHQDLGSGFHVASRDLELRGAGDLLGADQSGSINTIGMDMYLDLLSKTIDEIKGESTSSLPDTELNINISAIIPSAYIRSDKVRIRFYKLFFSVEDLEEIEDVKKEMRDQFGAYPDTLGLLFELAKLKCKLRQLKVSAITRKSSRRYELEFVNLSDKEAENLYTTMTRFPATFKPVSNNILAIQIEPGIEVENPNVVVNHLISVVSKFVSE